MTFLNDHESSDNQIQYITLSGVLVFFSIVLNSLIIWIVLKNNNMKTSFNIIIAHFSTADLMRSCFSVLFLQIKIFTNKWYFGEFLCKLTCYMECWGLNFRSFAIIYLALNRYCVLYRHIPDYQMKSETVRDLLLGWLVCSFLNIPMAFFAQLKSDAEKDQCRFEIYPNADPYISFMVAATFNLIYYAVPSITLIVLSLVIIGHLKKEKSFQNLKPSLIELHEEKQVNRLYTCYALCFVVSCLSQVILDIIVIIERPHASQIFSLKQANNFIYSLRIYTIVIFPALCFIIGPRFLKTLILSITERCCTYCQRDEIVSDLNNGYFPDDHRQFST